MNTQERDLITDLFRRLRNVAPVEKDRDADALIAEEMRNVPDAPYVMAQTVLVQEMALKKADERIRELQAQAASGARGGGGGFLGGFLGLGSGANNDAGDRGGSVPPVGAPPEAPYPRPGEPLPPLRSGGPGPGQPPAGGGGFLGQAMATATGVAGGLLLGEGLRGLLGGTAAAHAAGTSAQKDPTPPAPASNKDANDNDPGATHAEHSDADGDDEADGDEDDYDDFDDSIDI